MTTAAVETVTLDGGLTVSLDALRLVWALEGRGVAVRVEGSDIVLWPPALLTDDDVAAVRAMKADVRALVHYCDRDPHQRVGNRP
jgi:hypothetical protein